MDFEQLVRDTLDALPAEFADKVVNVEISVEDEPPEGRPWLGVYQGIPLTRRAGLAWMWPDRIRIFRGPLERLCDGDAACLEREVRHVVLHEIAHYFGISDERLIEIDRY